MKACIFCEIVAKRVPAHIVYETPDLLAFLDTTPLFAGHVLLIPKVHTPGFLDLNPSLHAQFMASAQLLAKAVPNAMRAEGNFIAINDRVSQSVPHLHCHIVPRKKGDGLKGFFWPRHKYLHAQHMQETQTAIEQSIAALQMGD